MRFLRVLPLLLTIAVIWALNHSFGSLPPIGKIVDPINGAMVAAERTNEDWNRNLNLKGLKEEVSIWLDTSLIPHIRAGNDHDLYYAQGFIHASFRLWQMDLQTRAAWGRVSEVAGPKAIDFDRGMRREGMVWGAQHSLEAMEAEPRTKVMLDAYRDGVNAYIHTLNYRSLPIEYKLMSFEPEDWTNLRTALLMKYMARDLTGKTDDIAYTILRDKLGQEEFDFLFPERIKGSKPVIPEGTKWDAPSLQQPKAQEGDVWAHFKDTATAYNRKAEESQQPGIAEGSPNLCHSDGNLISRSACGDSKGAKKVWRASQSLRENRFFQNDKVAENYVGRADDWSRCLQPQSEESGSESGIGSNNWAISGAHTASGKPILCNDPHLALNLPSLWYEMQLTAPGINAYGASLPGAPGIVIGFNEKISWGFTNNYRDVKDFYEIAEAPIPAFPRGGKEVSGEPKAEDLHTTSSPSGGGWEGAQRTRATNYLFNGKAVPFQRSIEVIKVKGARDVVDTVLYTIHGPVTYDPSFPDPAKSGKLLACTWMAHRGSNEILATYLLNRAGDYTAFTDAILHFECPAQNIAYADGAGNIAIWGQGRFIDKWKDQGKYVMRGDDSSTLWGQSIPMSENPHVLNPPQGYVASANQQVTDSTYPYWYNGSFVEWRSWEINEIMKVGLQKLKAVAFTEKSYNGGWDNPIAQNAFQNNVQSPYLAKIYSILVDNQPDLYTKLEGLFSELQEPLLYNRELALSATSSSATFFQIWTYQLYKNIWQDEFPEGTKTPSSELTVQLLLSDSTSKYYDDKRTQQVETLRDIVQRAFKETTDSLDKLSASAPPRFKEQALQWYNVKNTSLTHLAKLPAFSYDHLKIGGWSNTINAVTGNHGPSWRMIVEMDSIPKAYAIYPGGQSGNPGSRHYGDFIQQWVEGKYHAIQFLTAATTKNPLKYTWTLKP